MLARETDEKATQLRGQLPEIAAREPDDAVAAAVLLREYAAVLAHYQLRAPACGSEIRKLEVLAAAGRATLPELRSLFAAGKADVFYPLLAALQTQLRERDALIARLRDQPPPAPQAPPLPPPAPPRPDREREAEVLSLAAANDRLEAQNHALLAAAAALNRDNLALSAVAAEARQRVEGVQAQFAEAMGKLAGTGLALTKSEVQLAECRRQCDELRALAADARDQRDSALTRAEVAEQELGFLRAQQQRDRQKAEEEELRSARVARLNAERLQALGAELELAAEERRKLEGERGDAEQRAHQAQASLEKERTLRVLADIQRGEARALPVVAPRPPPPPPPDLDALFSSLREDVLGASRRQADQLEKKNSALKVAHGDELRARNDRIHALEARCAGLEARLADMRAQLERVESLPAALAEDNLAKQALIRRMEVELRAAQSQHRRGS